MSFFSRIFGLRSPTLLLLKFTFLNSTSKNGRFSVFLIKKNKKSLKLFMRTLQKKFFFFCKSFTKEKGSFTNFFLQGPRATPEIRETLSKDFLRGSSS